jgi:HEXXH motif-containing protein
MLLIELRRSMRSLVFDLCHDLAKYPPVVRRVRLPIDFWREVGRALREEDFSNWKVVGWIEGINDLLFFIDVRAQLAREPDRQGFADALWEDCRQRFYENSYVDELFPEGRPEAKGLNIRLTVLCARLAREATQDSVFLVPGLANDWVARRRVRIWEVAWDVGPDLEQAERTGTIPVGSEGAALESSAPSRLKVRGSQAAILRVTACDTHVRIGKRFFRVMSVGSSPDDQWTYRAEQWIRPGLTLGPTLRYRKDRTPLRVDPTPPGVGTRIREALQVIEEAWPEGAGLLALLTSRIVPLKATGVVSFSYRHRPGLSFINTFDRTQLDLIDDLIHENSHHHLNLLLRKFRLLKGEHTEEIFYSPWRRSLRSVYGILHATFTFTMGAILFERLFTWGAKQSESQLRAVGLGPHDILRARFRCLEEVESVRYSLGDLEYAAKKLGWLTASCEQLVRQLEEAIGKVERNIAPHRRGVQRSTFGPALRRHIEELHTARMTYGPVRLSKG